jgi:hypothetical protein
MRFPYHGSGGKAPGATMRFARRVACAPCYRQGFVRCLYLPNRESSMVPWLHLNQYTRRTENLKECSRGLQPQQCYDMKRNMKQILFGALGSAVAGLAGFALKRLKTRHDTQEGKGSSDNSGNGNAHRTPVKSPYPVPSLHFRGSVLQPSFTRRTTPASAGYYHRGNR